MNNFSFLEIVKGKVVLYYYFLEVSILNFIIFFWLVIVENILWVIYYDFWFIEIYILEILI